MPRPWPGPPFISAGTGTSPLPGQDRDVIVVLPVAGVLLHRAVTATGPRLAPTAGRGARRCLLSSRNRRDKSPRRRRRVALRHPGHRDHAHHRHHGAGEHPGAQGVARPPPVTRPHLGNLEFREDLWILITGKRVLLC